MFETAIATVGETVNQGIPSLPDLISQGFSNVWGNIVNSFVDTCKMCFAYLYELSHWGVTIYDIYQICCGVATNNNERFGKVVVSIIFYIFISIVAGVVL